jgi:predicted nucleic acid-binding protein
MYLVDTNLILEVLLRQAKSEEVKRFLEHARSDQLFLTEFSLYSLGVLLIRRNMHDIFLRAVEDLLFTGGMTLLRLVPADLADVTRRSKQFGIDFDDAYQYVAADKHNLVIVSFDADFDRTERGRKTPQTVLQT